MRGAVEPKARTRNVLGESLGALILSPCAYVDVPAEPGKSDFIYTKFFTKLHFLKETPNFTQIGTLYLSTLLKIGPIHHLFLIWAPSSLMNAPPPKKIAKNSKSGQILYLNHVKVRTPPPPPGCLEMWAWVFFSGVRVKLSIPIQSMHHLP